MFMAYSDSTGKNVTLSPRLSYGHVEPSYTKNITVEVLAGTKIENGNYTVNAMCSNCRSWKGGSIDPTNTAAKFNYATGPGGSLKSNSLTAGIKRHDLYGAFTMDLTKAIGVKGVPAIQFADGTGTLQTEDDSDRDLAPPAHAVLMILAFVGMMPLAVMILRILNSPKWHGIAQTASALVALIGTGVGIKAGMQYNRVSPLQVTHCFSILTSIPVQGLQFCPSNLWDRGYHGHDRSVRSRIPPPQNVQEDTSNNKTRTNPRLARKGCNSCWNSRWIPRLPLGYEFQVQLGPPRMRSFRRRSSWSLRFLEIPQEYPQEECACRRADRISSTTVGRPT